MCTDKCEMSLEYAPGAKPLLCIGLNMRQSTASTDSPNTVEPRYNEGLRDWQNLFTITRLRELEVVFHIYYFYQGKENRWGDGEASQEKLKNFAGTTKNIMFSFLKKAYCHKMSVRQTKKTVSVNCTHD